MKSISTHEVRIYMAGAAWQIENVCRQRCMKGDLCVTVTPTTFVYNGATESGVIVGLIKYPRFPDLSFAIDEKAFELAKLLMTACSQRSCCVATPDNTHYLENPEFTATQAARGA